MTTTTTQHTTVAEAYIAAFNETDGAARRERLAALCAPGVRYTDPNVDVHGHDGLDGFIGATHEQFPGLCFTLHGPVDGHHDQARFRWAAGPYVGFDVVSLDADGRIERVLGFIDEAPQG